VFVENCKIPMTTKNQAEEAKQRYVYVRLS